MFSITKINVTNREKIIKNNSKHVKLRLGGSVE